MTGFPEHAVATHEPLSMTPVEDTGWRVVYADPESPGGGFQIAPVVAWGVFRVTWRYPGTGRPDVVEGNVMEGVVADTRGGQVVDFGPAWSARFVYYLPPGVPDPTDPAEVRRAHEENQARRRARVNGEAPEAGLRPRRRRASTP